MKLRNRILATVRPDVLHACACSFAITHLEEITGVTGIVTDADTTHTVCQHVLFYVVSCRSIVAIGCAWLSEFQ